MKCVLLSEVILYWLCFLVALSVQACCGGGSDDYDGNTCDAKIADSCFRDVYTNLQCHFKSNSTPNLICAKKNVDDLCSAINEALDCSSDIVTTDCTKYEGSDKFNRWLQALRSVYSSLCSGNREAFKNLINNPQCWSITPFIACVENNLNVKHVVDMLKVEWSVIRATVAVAACNAKLANPKANCLSATGAINEMIHTFFETYGNSCISGSSKLHSTRGHLLNPVTCFFVGYAYLKFN